MENSNSIVGQILALHMQGYSAQEITAELKTRPYMDRTPLKYVRTVLRQNTGRSADSRRLFEMYEILLEVLSILREIRGIDESRLAQRMRGIEKTWGNAEGMPRSELPALTESSLPDRRP